MDVWHDTILALLREQRVREQREEFRRVNLQMSAPRAGPSGLRRSIGSSLVRWGLRLDPSAGDRVRPLDLAGQGRR